MLFREKQKSSQIKIHKSFEKQFIEITFIIKKFHCHIPLIRFLNSYFEIPIGIGAFSIVHSATTSFLSLQINNPMVSLSSSPFIK